MFGSRFLSTTAALASAALFATSSPATAQTNVSGQPLAPATTQYLIGSPTNEQQYMLELINRARANGSAEASRTGLSGLQEGPPSVNGQTWTIANSVQPLSWNSMLANAAQNQATNLNTADQFFLGGSPHTFGGLTPEMRIIGAGYPAAQYNGPTTPGGFFPGEENVSQAETQGSGIFSGAKLIQAVLDAHNGLFVDTTVPDRGHRSTMMLGFFREIGIGISSATDNETSPGQPNGLWDSLYIVQDYGTANGSTPFITGVVYNDANGNGFYDSGEGIGGVRVDVIGSNYFAVTSSSGGYSVPVPANGTYDVTFSGGGTTTTTQTATIANNANAKLDFVTAAVASTTSLASISTRARVGTGENVMIGGFSLKGPGQKQIAVRGLGPVLTQYNVPNVLANPTLTLFRGQTALASNDDWSNSPQTQATISAKWNTSNSSESVLLLTLPEGDYTAIVGGVGANPTGAALVQIYDTDPNTTPKLQSISTRAVVGSNDDVMIGGITIQGNGTQKVVFRGIGPSLTQFGVVGALTNPMLRVVDANGSTVALNDDWQTDADAAELMTLQLAPSSLQEPAVVTNLTSGDYTAIVSGVNSTTGIGLVQVYKID